MNQKNRKERLTKRSLFVIMNWFCGEIPWFSKAIVYFFEAWLSLVERCVRDAEAAGSSPVASTKKFDKFQLVEFFYPLRKQWYIITRHACISSPKVYIISRRLYCALAMMIYNSCGIDDMQDYVLTIYTASPWFMQEFKFIRKTAKSLFFVAHSQKISFFGTRFFYPLRKQWYIISPLGLYIITRSVYQKNFAMMIYKAYALMICNFYEIDEIQRHSRW